MTPVPKRMILVRSAAIRDEDLGRADDLEPGGMTLHPVDKRQPRQQAMQIREGRKKRRNPLPSLACLYCERPATTRDHVPPKAIFVELRLPDLVTVPACEECNYQGSRFDEGFRNIIGMRASEESSNSLTLWEKTFRSLKRRRQRGLYWGTATEAAFDAEARDRTIERITRGLYFHHFGRSLPLDTPVEAYPFCDGTDWQKGVTPLLMRMRVGNIGGPAIFEYVFARDENEPNASVWIYRFTRATLPPQRREFSLRVSASFDGDVDPL